MRTYWQCIPKICVLKQQIKNKKICEPLLKMSRHAPDTYYLLGYIINHIEIKTKGNSLKSFIILQKVEHVYLLCRSKSEFPILT